MLNIFGISAKAIQKKQEFEWLNFALRWFDNSCFALFCVNNFTVSANLGLNYCKKS